MKVAIETETNKKGPPAGDPFFVYYKWQLRSRSGIRHLAFFINSATWQLTFLHDAIIYSEAADQAWMPGH